MFAAALAMMFWYSPALTVVSVALSLLPIAVSILAGNRVAAAEKRVSDLNESYMSTLRDSLVGFSVIKSFRSEAQMCRIFVENVRQVSDAKEARRKVSIIIQMLSAVAGVIVQLGGILDRRLPCAFRKGCDGRYGSGVCAAFELCAQSDLYGSRVPGRMQGSPRVD